MAAVAGDDPGEGGGNGREGGPEARRPSIEKRPTTVSAHEHEISPAFERLPDEIIHQILKLTDPSSFASLVLLNSKWRSVSQHADLYAYHLSRCPSYSASHKSMPRAGANNLPELRRAFAREVKRNLFDAYLRPRRTVVKLVSNSISSSSCPGGEGMQFNPSPRGHHLLAYNSSRIYVIDLRGPNISVKRELKILRRPAATCVKDDGSFLAVLLTEMQVDLYDLRQSPPRRTQSIILDHSPRAIALSPCGTVLAAAYEGGIEVSSLNPGALVTDRRAVKCDGVDTLAFSFDGTQILGTTVHAAQPNTVILTAPYYDPGSHMAEDNISALWTTSILFPNTSRDCSHAVLLQTSSREEASWAFTYDRSFETFRAVRIDDLRNGTTYFTGPIPSPTSQAKLLPSTLPSASYCGELVSAGFQGKEIWLYGVPEDLDAIPDTAAAAAAPEGAAAPNSHLNRRNSGPSMRSMSRMQDHASDAVRVPQWQVLCDKLRNTFVAGCKVGELEGANTVKWVEGFGESCLKERLVVAARGVMPPKPITEEDGIDFVDGGRLLLVDFDYGVEDGQVTEVTVEVGTREPEVLEEEHRDMDTEVAIVRRRTVAQRRGNRSAVMRAATTVARPPSIAHATPQPDEQDPDDPLVPRRIGVPPSRRPREEQAAAEDEEEETQAIIEEQEALDAPYSHASPRSGTTLRRAATAAAINRRLNPQTASGGRIQYRRADGRREHPHESDADNWVPPPPPYQKDDPLDLPDFMRHTVAPVAADDASQESPSQGGLAPAAGPAAPGEQSTVAQSEWAQPQPQPQPQPSPLQGAHYQAGSGSSSAAALRPSTGVSGRSSVSEEGIYDVSPPGTPRHAATMPAGGVGGMGGIGDMRDPSGSSQFTTASAAAGAPGGQTQISPATGTPGRAGQALPGMPANSARPISPADTRPPALELHIPSPTLTNLSAWYTPSGSVGSPAPRALANSQTWPTAPPSSSHVAPAVLPAGYPYSAPPTNLDASDMIAQSYPPPPRPDQLASLHRHEDAEPPVRRRLSGAYQVVPPRVPVGSRDGRRVSSGGSGNANANVNRFPQPQPQPQLQLQPQLQHQQLAPPRQRYPEIHPVVPPVEDQPLIISTPKGVTGAFDPPGRVPSSRRQETPILAPIPRHPRQNERSALVRPTVERLETIYSVASNQSNNSAPLPLPLPLYPPGTVTSSVPTSIGGSSYLTAPPPPPASLSTGTGKSSSTLFRKQSRAERSAARNMADAKKRGWRRSKSKRGKQKKQERDFDAASSAAWTDVTTASSAVGGYPYYHPGAYHHQQYYPPQGQGQGQGLGPDQDRDRDMLQQPRDKGGSKCAVM